MTILTKSVMTCPVCKTKKEESMPTDFYQANWQCPKCHMSVIPKRGEDCVFCSYGTVPCPKRQQQLQEQKK